MIKKNIIAKYPYLGYSPNLIQYFGIIGYQEEFVNTIIKEINKTPGVSNNPFRPTIINSVISNIDNGTTDNDLMLSQIYPDNPNIIKANLNDQIPPPSSVIYSFCFDSQDGKKKIFYSCYAYRFYEIFKSSSNNNNEVYYIPKAFSVMSQYSFFNTFHYICENLLKIINLKLDKQLPIEIIIYCIINYLPTPMNYNISINVFDSLLKIDPIKLEQLSGYPTIDFDMSEIFNLLPINLMLEIYLFTFLEQKMLFFSQNLEILNMVMYIMFLLNYPCNDSIYFWHIVSVSLKDFTADNRFVGKVMDSLIGVNTTYVESINTSVFGSYYFIVDLDNKKIFLEKSINDPEDEEYKDLLDIQEFFQNCLKDKNIDSFFLKDSIKELKTNLENILFKELVGYTPYPKNKYVDFFKVNPKINKKIQESFYNFCLNVLRFFYKDNELNTSFDKITNKENKLKSVISINGREVPLPDYEIKFCEFFRDSIKYQFFFENFIQNNETMDIFRIPLLFSEEFIYLKNCVTDNSSLSNVSFFKIIDTLYIQSMPQTINISINNIYPVYDKFRKHFDYLIQNKKENESEKQLFRLDKKIFNKFIYLLNNKFENEDVSEIFPSLKLQSSDFIDCLDQRSIKDIIQNYLINKNIIKTSHCILFSVVYVFALTMSIHPFNQLLTYLCEILKSLNDTPFFKRFYINIIIQTLHKYSIINMNEKKYPDMNLNNVKIYYYLIVNNLKQHGIIPDEEMMSILSFFFGGTILQEREIKNNNKKDKNNGNNIINENENNENQNESNNETSKKSQNLELKVNTPFPIKFKYNFMCFIRNSFTANGTIKQRKIVKAALNEKNGINNMVISVSKNKTLTPIIIVKVKEYIYTSDFYTPMKILRLINQLYIDFFDNFNLNLKKINLDQLRKILTNLIQYGIELNSVHIPFDFLIYTLYALKDITEKVEKKEKKKEEKKEEKKDEKMEKEDKEEKKEKEEKEDKKEDKKEKEEKIKNEEKEEKVEKEEEEKIKKEEKEDIKVEKEEKKGDNEEKEDKKEEKEEKEEEREDKEDKKGKK